MSKAEENLKKKIKKNIYGKAQTIEAVFPAGFSSIALDEVKSILENLWFAKNLTSEFSILKNEIQIANIHMFAIVELLMRAQCLSDIRLIICRGKTSGKFAFEKKCRDIDWDFYLNKKMSVKIKVNSVASRAFHETGLKEILTDILKDHVSEIVSGENTHETTCIYVDLHKDKLTISISLAGESLYKRGYRGVLSASAPLREDAATCCIKTALKFADKFNKNFLPDTVLIPFSGTGTFAFEYMQYHYQFSPALFGREYALQKMPLFRSENFSFLLKKALEKDIKNQTHIFCIDNSDNANAALLENIAIFKDFFTKNSFSLSEISSYKDNFLEMDVAKIIAGDVFIPLNPPYGIRLNKNADPASLYKNIARKINEVSTISKKEKKNVLGFVLCPSEETWSSFYKNLRDFNIETYHFNQGGMDVRVCQFFS